MMLIIEIALGIVLGFLILTNLDAIFALGVIAVGGAIALALLAVVSETTVFSALIYKWSSDAADSLLYLFLVPIMGLWAWFWIKASRHIRERKNPVATVGIPGTSPIGGAQ